jgi:site-specific DNA recombinase
MKVAIYSRKSKFTGKGESIENQIEMCSEYARSHFKDIHIVVYEDEGFSGGNIDRPEFKRLLKAIKAKQVDILMCYRLDRISRNVADFCSTLEILEKNNVAFVSIKEQFDTTSPMGRAMTYISSVFAQLERETIAERVRDNMLQLARSGRWLGGHPPLGFISQEIISQDLSGKSHKLYQLIQLSEEVNSVNFLYKSFLEIGSLIKLESYLIKENIKTKKDKYYNLSSLRFILTNPVYVTADALAFDYFTQRGCGIYSEKSSFNGLTGVMPYNRTKQSQKTSVAPRDTSEWIIAVGTHKPIIDSKTWIEVQSIMERNKDKTFRKIHNQEALFSGLLRCSVCGSYMRPKKSRLSTDGTKHHYYYICELKEKSNGRNCNVKNIAGHTLDDTVTKELKKLCIEGRRPSNKFVIDNLQLTDTEDYTHKHITALKNEISTHEHHINKLLSALGEASNTLSSKYIIQQINILGAKIKEADEKCHRLESKLQSNTLADINLFLIKTVVKDFNALDDHAPILKKRKLIQSILKAAHWDGENLKLDILGDNSLGKL